MSETNTPFEAEYDEEHDEEYDGEHDADRGQPPEGAPDTASRDTAAAVRALRESLGMTQAELADRIGTRQQTVSEWETGTRAPRRMSLRLLRMVAEESGHYQVDGGVSGEAAGADAFADPPRAPRGASRGSSRAPEPEA